jgi:hypothetical protein
MTRPLVLGWLVGGIGPFLTVVLLVVAFGR